MIRDLLLIFGFVLTIIAIILYIAKKSTAASIVVAIFAFVTYSISLFPAILNQEIFFEPGITLDVHNLVLTDKATLSATAHPNNAIVEWSSGNIDLVTVDNNGNLEARREGIVAITASIEYKGNYYFDKCVVTVKISPEENIFN